jgi:hypothetical protein
VVGVTNPYGRILGFLDRKTEHSRMFIYVPLCFSVPIPKCIIVYFFSLNMLYRIFIKIFPVSHKIFKAFKNCIILIMSRVIKITSGKEG